MGERGGCPSLRAAVFTGQVPLLNIEVSVGLDKGRSWGRRGSARMFEVTATKPGLSYGSSMAGKGL